MKKKRFRLALIMLCGGVFLYGCWGAGATLYEDFSARRSYAGVAAFVSAPTEAPAGEKPAATTAGSAPGATPAPSAAATSAVTLPAVSTASLATPEIALPVVDFDGLRDVNEDLVAWIYCEDTPIHYPVVQGEDNDEYLHRLFDGSSHKAGCIFLDYRNAADFTSPHSVLYGHHMKDGSMFASIVRYGEQAYFDEHPTLLLLTPERAYEVELVAGYDASVWDDAWQLDFDSEEDFAAWIARARKRSDFVSPYEVSPKDRVITLSTCSYDFDQARYVLLGVLRPLT